MNRNEIREFFDILVDDCSKAAQLWRESNDGYTKRSYVRAVFAFIEGNTYRMKQICLYAHDNGFTILSEKERIQASEVNKKGETIKMRTLDNVKLSFKLFSKIFDVKNTLDTDGNDWINFKDALEIRHKLTHPKSIEAFELSEQDLIIIENAAEFYRDSTFRLVSGESMEPGSIEK